MQYTCDVSSSFNSISHILRDVSGGWLLRSLHANGATFFFITLYLHLGRGIYFGSYLMVAVWVLGVTLLVVSMAIAFLGYVLPWGQMRYWGATVITNLFGVLPYLGGALVNWLWGGFSVDNPTLTRFYTLHFLLPFVLLGLIFIHLFFLHLTGSNNPLGVKRCSEKVPFHWYYTIKDVFGFSVILTFLLIVVFFKPSLFMEADNYIPATPLVTPAHILPEWYFLFAYTILKCIPSKAGGVLGLVCSILFLLTLIFTHGQRIKGLSFYGFVKLWFWLHVTVFLLLTAAGSWPVVIPFIFFTRLFTVLFFSFYFLLGPLRAFWDFCLC